MSQSPFKKSEKTPKEPFKLKIDKQFRAEASMMLAEIDAAYQATRHPTIYGGHNETIFINFLQKYLPSRFTISQGQIVDPSGKLSPQCDVLIHDQTVYPPAMVFADGTKVVYLHSIYAVIEVKTTLDKRKFTQTLQNFESIKTMEKRTREHFQEKKGLKRWTVDEIIEIKKYLFAYNCIRDLKTIQKWFSESMKNNKMGKRVIDNICVLKLANKKGGFIESDKVGVKNNKTYSNDNNALLTFYKSVYNDLCIQDKVEPGTLEGTKEIVDQYNLLNWPKNN